MGAPSADSSPPRRAHSSSTAPTTAPGISRRCPGSRSITSTPLPAPRWSRSPTRRLRPSSPCRPSSAAPPGARTKSLRFAKGGREIFPVEYQAVEHVIIHHADTANFNDPVLEMRSIYYFHAITRAGGILPTTTSSISWAMSTKAGGRRERRRLSRRGVQPRECRRLPDGALLRGLHHPGDAQRHRLDRLVGRAQPRPYHQRAVPRYPRLPTFAATGMSTTPPARVRISTSPDTVRTEVRRVISGRDDPAPPPPQWVSGVRVITNADGVSCARGRARVRPGRQRGRRGTADGGGRAHHERGQLWYQVRGASLTGWIASDLLVEDPNPSPYPSIRSRPKHR